jgi:hypothetical protein
MQIVKYKLGNKEREIFKLFLIPNHHCYYLGQLGKLSDVIYDDLFILHQRRPRNNTKKMSKKANRCSLSGNLQSKFEDAFQEQICSPFILGGDFIPLRF